MRVVDLDRGHSHRDDDFIAVIMVLVLMLMLMRAMVLRLRCKFMTLEEATVRESHLYLSASASSLIGKLL